MLIRALSLMPLFSPDDQLGGTPVAGVPPVPPSEDDEDDLRLDDEHDEPDDQQDEPDDGVDPQQDEPPRRRGRPPANETIRALKAQNKDAVERAARIERELSEFRERERRREMQEQTRNEEDRLALMTPDERIEYRFQKAAEENKRILAQQQFQMADTSDKMAFAAKAAADPKGYHARYHDEVEKLLAETRRGGINVPRETVLAAVLGRKVLERASNPSPKRPAARSARPQPPAASRGDASAGNRRNASLEKRLENVPL